MAERAFTIVELHRAGDGGMVETPVRFTWTNTNRAAPREGWKFGVEQRTVRTDYPGAEEPVEQVLGPNYKDFTLSGIWDDRYNEPGFALVTYRAFEQLVQRGGLCRFEFETITINGIIKDADFNYQRKDYIAYTFTVSPHYRQQGTLSRTGPVRRKTPEGLKSPGEYRDVAGAQITAMEGFIYGDAFMKNTLKGDLFPTTAARTEDLRDKFNKIVTAIDQRIDARVEQFEALKRVSMGFAVLKGAAAEMLTDLAGAKSSLQMAFDDAEAILTFDEWCRSMAAYARLLILTSEEANRELSRRIEPKAIALYRPYKGESLYGISQRFYGTPGAWRKIAERNGLTTMTLQGTEALIIPERR